MKLKEFFFVWIKFLLCKKKERMPKQGGQGKGKPKMKDRGFGKALMRKQAQGDQGL